MDTEFEETHLVWQPDAQDFSRHVALDNPVNGLQEIAPEDESDACRRPEHDAHQQVGEHNPQHRHNEGNELAPALPPHLPEQARVG